MSITKAIQENFALLGIESNAAKQSTAFNVFNVRSAITITVYCLSVSLTSAYLFCEAESFSEYMDSVSITSATAIDTFTYFSFFCRLDMFSKFINSLEETFENSK